MNKYELAVHETQSVLAEWLVPWAVGGNGPWSGDLGKVIVDRLIAKGVIQSTNEEDLIDFRTGPLEPGTKVIGGSK